VGLEVGTLGLWWFVGAVVFGACGLCGYLEGW
jgi:hypothetical protein